MIVQSCEMNKIQLELKPDLLPAVLKVRKMNNRKLCKQLHGMEHRYVILHLLKQLHGMEHRYVILQLGEQLHGMKHRYVILQLR